MFLIPLLGIAIGFGLAQCIPPTFKWAQSTEYVDITESSSAQFPKSLLLFGAVFSCYQDQNFIFYIFLDCSVRSKKLNNIKVKKKNWKVFLVGSR